MVVKTPAARHSHPEQGCLQHLRDLVSRDSFSNGLQLPIRRWLQPPPSDSISTLETQPSLCQSRAISSMGIALSQILKSLGSKMSLLSCRAGKQTWRGCVHRVTGSFRLTAVGPDPQKTTSEGYGPQFGKCLPSLQMCELPFCPS